MKLIFVSGAYRAGTKAGISQNIKNAREASKLLWQQGWAVICPHMNTAHFWNIVTDDNYLEGYLEMLRKCDAIYMLKGWEKSSGSVAEYNLAVELGIEIIYQI